MGGSHQKPHIGKIFGTAEKTIVNGRGTHPCTWRARPPRARGCDGRRSRARANLWGVSWGGFAGNRASAGSSARAGEPCDAA